MAFQRRGKLKAGVSHLRRGSRHEFCHGLIALHEQYLMARLNLFYQVGEVAGSDLLGDCHALMIAVLGPPVEGFGGALLSVSFSSQNLFGGGGVLRLALHEGRSAEIPDVAWKTSSALAGGASGLGVKLRRA